MKIRPTSYNEANLEDASYGEILRPGMFLLVETANKACQLVEICTMDNVTVMQFCCDEGLISK